MNKKFTSRMYQLYELRDALPEGIKKNEELLNLENEFLEVIEKSGKKEKFAFITKDFETENKQLKESIFLMKQRYELVKDLIKMYEKRDSDSKVLDYVASTLLEAIGAASAPMTKEDEK